MKAWSDDVIQFLVNSEKPRGAAMHNTGTGFVVLLHHSLFKLQLRNRRLDYSRYICLERLFGRMFAASVGVQKTCHQNCMHIFAKF